MISRKKTLVGALVVVALALLIAVIWFLFISRDSNESNVGAPTSYDACLNDDIGARLKNEFPWFTVDSVEPMKDLITSVEALPNVDQAINCQFVLAKYVAYGGDLQGSINHYQKVVSIYESDGQWVDILVGTDTPDDVRELIVSYKETADLLIGQTRAFQIKETTE